MDTQDQLPKSPAVSVAPLVPEGSAALPAEPARPVYKRPGTIIVALAVVIGVVFGIRYFLHGSRYETTDNATIEGTTVSISAKVPGTVVEVYVRDNEDVAASTLLARIDDRDLQAQLDRAQANLTAAQSRLRVAQTNVALTQANTDAALSQADAGIAQSQAAVASAEAQLASAQADVLAAQAESTRRDADLKRFEKIDPRGVSQQQIDAARAAFESASAQLEAASKRVSGAESAVRESQARVLQAKATREAAATGPQQIASAQAEVEAAEAAVTEAEARVKELSLQVSYTSIYAPMDGRVTKKAINPGQNVVANQPLMAVVSNNVWVVANFKETQLDHMQVGQPVTLAVDAYPDRKFHGHVDSIQAGTGAHFSLLPPENATGNYVKVVQRIPVKILFDDAGDAPLLSLGMSVVPTVDISRENGRGPMAIKAPAPTTQASLAQVQR